MTMDSWTMQHCNYIAGRTVELQPLLSSWVTSSLSSFFASIRVRKRPGGRYQGWNQRRLHHSPPGHAESEQGREQRSWRGSGSQGRRGKIRKIHLFFAVKVSREKKKTTKYSSAHWFLSKRIILWSSWALELLTNVAQTCRRTLYYIVGDYF